jgi:zinc transporter 10
MIPELSSAHEDEGNLIQCILHLSGLLLGFGIMTLIALYEHDLKNIFRD